MFLHNPVGFSFADFAELALAVAFLLFALKPVFLELAARPFWCAAALAMLPIALRLALLPWHPVPVPAGADDFSYLLLCDTLAHLRLANAVHPMHRFFEAVFVLQEPSYSSIYPLGQGLALAFGQLLFGLPWAGVLLATAGFCVSAYWMLRGWTTPEWALAGGFLAICEFGPLNRWTNTYWGGAVSATAGCLIFGALPRLSRSFNRRDALLPSVLLGVGLAVQLLTRPFEFAILLPILIPWLAWSGRGRLSWRAAACVLLPLLPAPALVLLQNRQVTGDWTMLPYQLSRYQYGVPASFTFQPNPVPHRHLTAEEQLDYAAQSAIHGDGVETLSTYFARLATRVHFLRFFFLAPLYLALPFFVLSWHERGYLWIAGILCALVLGTNFYPYFYPQYIAAATSLFLLIAVTSLGRMSQWTTGRRASHLLLAVSAAHFLFWYIAGTGQDPWYFINAPDPDGRAAIENRLDSAPGRQLVFVRYAPRHMFHEWIHNAADIDRSRVVWAADRGDAENQQLLRYYPNRTAWIVEPDARPPTLTSLNH